MALIDNILNGTPRRQRKIQYGIYVEPGINNAHHLQQFDRLKEFFTKVDTRYGYRYLKPIGSGENVEDAIYDAKTEFADDAKWIRNLDSPFGHKSEFFLVSFLTDNKGKISEISKIQQLFF